MAKQQKKVAVAPRPKDRNDTELRIIKAAAEIFSEIGYDRATTRMIAERAHSNIALIARYFENKQGLFAAVLTAARGDGVRLKHYEPQDNLLDESTEYVTARLKMTFEKFALFRIVMVQGTIDDNFFKYIRPEDFEHDPAIYARFAELRKKEGLSHTEKSTRLYVNALDHMIYGFSTIDKMIARRSDDEIIADIRDCVRIMALRN